MSWNRRSSTSGWGWGSKVGGFSNMITFVGISRSQGPATMIFLALGPISSEARRLTPCCWGGWCCCCWLWCSCGEPEEGGVLMPSGSQFLSKAWGTVPGMSQRVCPLALLKKYGRFSRRLQNFLQPCCKSSWGRSTSKLGLVGGGAGLGVWGIGIGPGVPGVPGVPGATGREFWSIFKGVIGCWNICYI